MHIHFLQLLTVTQTSLNIGHTSLISIYKLLLCQFWDSQCNRTWIYANMWVSLCIWLAFGSVCQFKCPICNWITQCLMCDWQFWYLNCVSYCSDRQVKQLSDHPGLSVVDPTHLAPLTLHRQPHSLDCHTKLRTLNSTGLTGVLTGCGVVDFGLSWLGGINNKIRINTRLVSWDVEHIGVVAWLVSQWAIIPISMCAVRIRVKTALFIAFYVSGTCADLNTNL